ncbi:hypothetical protein JRQ81_017927, partial [Phrynocephalus forsythii]
LLAFAERASVIVDIDIDITESIQGETIYMCGMSEKLPSECRSTFPSKNPYREENISMHGMWKEFQSMQ